MMQKKKKKSAVKIAHPVWFEVFERDLIMLFAVFEGNPSGKNESKDTTRQLFKTA